jgi:hypothetical protein
MIPKYTLIIIDIQPQFRKSYTKSLFRNCRREIRKAKIANNNIVLVEYSGCGKTSKRLTELVEDYDNVSYVTKEHDDGSYAIVPHLVGKKLIRNNLRICGINTDACVCRTVRGLRKRLPNSNIVVVENACWSSYNHKHGLTLTEPYASGFERAFQHVVQSCYN